MHANMFEDCQFICSKLIFAILLILTILSASMDLSFHAYKINFIIGFPVSVHGYP